MPYEDLKALAGYTKKVLTASDMSAIEENARWLGVDSTFLMENAASAISDFVNEKFSNKKNILIVCGRGNNGGDGDAAARHLSQCHDVSIVLLGNVDQVRQFPASANWKILEKMHSVKMIEDPYSDYLEQLIKKSELVLDAIVGTGFRGKLEGVNLKAVETINRLKNKYKYEILSVDLPSGLDSTNRQMVDADFVVTFHKLKEGLVKNGRTVVKNIGIPVDAELMCGPGELKTAARIRKLYGGKRDSGYVLIIGGSGEYHGAPALASNAAYNLLASLRTGAGYAKVYVPESVKDAVRKVSPNTIVRSFGDESFTDQSVRIIEREMSRANAVVLGMGIGRSKETLDAVRETINIAHRLGKKLVVDADAIYAVDKKAKTSGSMILTPQDNEMNWLLSGKPSDNLSERALEVANLSKKLRCSILFKGHTTIISNGELIKINFSESSALATMGTGDVLSGIVGGYAATGSGIFESGVAGAHLHSSIGDSLAREKGTHIIASDVVEKIPEAIKAFDVEM